MELTTRLIEENNLTALMVTHNLQDALSFGDRTLMMDEGEVVLDLAGEERKKMTIEELLERFSELRHKRGLPKTEHYYLLKTKNTRSLF